MAVFFDCFFMRLHMNTQTDHALKTPEQAAAYLAISERQLQLDRVTKRSIPFVKVGRLVRYKQSDLDAFIAAQTVGGNAA
jgi:excisionase family DNA binding protein